MAEVLETALVAGREALQRHAWQEAYALLKQASDSVPLSAKDFEALAEAADWAGEFEAHLGALERAYCAHRDEGNQRRAAYLAMLLARGHGNKLARAVAAGWMARAERLLEGQPECAEYGHLLVRRALAAQSQADLDGCRELAQRAAEVGERFGDRDLWAIATHTVGQALLQQGSPAEGLALIDEASAAAVGGELSPSATGLVYCWTISTCRDLADVARAGEWTEAANRWCETQSITGFPGVCRIHRAEIMRLRGVWREAEQEAERASRELPRFNPRMAGGAFAELGEIRLRMGNWAAAEEAFDQADQLGAEPEPGRSLLYLYKGDSARALRSIQRALEAESWDRFARARLLPAKLEIALAAGDLEEASSAADELEALFRDYGGALYEASALHARGTVQSTSGDTDAALRNLRRALKLWREVDAPYEAACARMLLARAYRALDEPGMALSELRAALREFERLGAATDVRLAREELGAIERNEASPLQPAGVRITRAFMFTDIVKSTNLLEAIGDDAWEALVQWHNRTLQALFEHYGGEVVNRAGDGFFVAFSEPAPALDCAIAIQRSLREHRRTHGFSPRVRIGVHVAEATDADGSYTGKGVHEAARIGALAEGDEILASKETVVAAGSAYSASEARPVALKGISQPVQVCNVRV